MTSGDPNEGHVKTVALSLGERESHEMVLTGESRAETQGHRVPAAAMRQVHKGSRMQVVGPMRRTFQAGRGDRGSQRW